MTAAEQRLFDYLVEWHAIHKCLPSTKQIAFDLARDTSVISRLLARLADHGKIERLRGPVNYTLPEKQR